MRDILVLCPQERDLKAIRAAGLEGRYRVHFAGSDLDQLQDFDPEAFLDECEALPADAVLGTKDQSALLAALLAERRGLPGPSPQALVACQHKPTARGIQQRVAPGATRRSRHQLGPPFDSRSRKPVVDACRRRVRIEDPASCSEPHEIDRYTTRYSRLRHSGASPQRSASWPRAPSSPGTRRATSTAPRRRRSSLPPLSLQSHTTHHQVPGHVGFEGFFYTSSLLLSASSFLTTSPSALLPSLLFEGGFSKLEFFVPEAVRHSSSRQRPYLLAVRRSARPARRREYDGSSGWRSRGSVVGSREPTRGREHVLRS